MTIADGVKNFTLEKIKFYETGVTFGEVENVCVKNCTFSLTGKIQGGTENIVKNLIIDGCEFKNISDGLASAIKIRRYEGLTVKNCVFDGVEYNALQVGHEFAGGAVLIENNIFRNIGSRVIYLVTVEGLSSCLLRGNKFYDNTDALLSVGDIDDGIKKSSGVYIHTQSKEGTITVGENYWENIPNDNVAYIASVAYYNKTEQKSINGEK